MTDPDLVRRCYDIWAATYDTGVNRTRDLNASLIRREIHVDVSARVLEIGCGTGINTAYLAGTAREIVAVDVSEGMLSAARERVPQNRVQFVRADITAPWSFPGTFDLIVANLVLEHISDIDHVFREAVRVMRDGALFYLAELHPLRQLVGSQARFTPDAAGSEVRVPVALHSTSEFVSAALGHGLRLTRMAEWPDEEGGVPRLLTLHFLKAHAGS